MVKKMVLFIIMAAIVVTILIAVNVDQTSEIVQTGNEKDQVTMTIEKVYVTPNGAKFHLKTCRTLKNSNEVIEINLEDAKSKGYEPCKVCKPMLVTDNDD